MKRMIALYRGMTMYQIVLYSLVLIIIAAFITSGLGVLGFTPLSLLVSLLVIVLTSFGSHKILVRMFGSAPSIESWMITALILFLILKPAQTKSDYAVLLLGSLLAVTSKYLITFRRHHLFNPVAFALVVLGLLGSGNVYWWVGSIYLFPLVTILGFIIVRRLQLTMTTSIFLLSALIAYLASRGLSTETLKVAIISGPIVFFAVFMLTEPQTAPHRHKMRLVYAVLVGLLYGIPFALPPLVSTPELALLIGNIFAFLVNSNQQTVMTFTGFSVQAKGIYEFSFLPKKHLKFMPGQYIEWTLPHTETDIRGDRRFFTIASSPTEPSAKLVVRIDQHHSSSFKRALLVLKPGSKIWVSQLSGEFILPTDTTKKLVFIAGGIGITPFRSMVQNLIDTNKKRDITLYYAAQTADGFSYADLFKSAENNGVKTFCTITGSDVPSDWPGRTGRVRITDIQREVERYKNAVYYLSGPNAMVAGYKRQLIKSGVRRTSIKTDYFPGF